MAPANAGAQSPVPPPASGPAPRRRVRAPAIAPEGLPLVVTALLGGVLLTALAPVLGIAPPVLRSFLFALSCAGPIVVFFGLFSAFFFRDPERESPRDQELVLSAADGRVTSVEQTAEGLTIAVFMSIMNVHLNRAPVDGVVRQVAYKAGEFLGAWKPLAEKVNERVTVAIDTPRGRVVVTQIAGFVARRIVCRVRAGDQLRAGDRFGLIRFGSCAVVQLPPGAQPLVEVKDRVTGGVTPIARWAPPAAERT